MKRERVNKTELIALRMEPSTRQDLKDLAAKTHKSESHIVRQLIKFAAAASGAGIINLQEGLKV